jgi:hypothetical protein
MKQNLRHALLLVLALILGSATYSWGQTIVTGGFTGTLTDPSGAAVPGATLTLKNAATGEVSTATTSDSGVYQFVLLKPGDYSLTVTKDGFKTLTRTVTVQLGQNATVNVPLELGSGATTVEVTEEGALLQTENANIATTFDTRAVQNLPNPGNDLTYVAQTAPGVSMNTSSGNGYGNFSAFGLPGTANLFTINGNDYNDPFLNLNNSGASNLLLGTNDVQEVAVVSNGYTGQYGRQAGAQIDYTTKSGTNAFHGGANYYWTGDALNANDFFLNKNQQPRPFQNNNQWSANFGGPIKKDKLFFFADTEGLRYIFATATSSFLPTPAFQQFVLSQVPASATAFYQQAFALYNGAKGADRAVPTPNTCASVGALPGGSTDCLSNVTLSGASGNQEWLLIGRVDWNINDNNKVFGRVKFDRGTQPTYADPINPAFNAISHQPQNEGQLNYTHIFSPSIANNFIFSDLYYSAIFQSVNLAKANATFPEILCSSDSGLSCLGAAGGEFPLTFFFPQGRNVEQWQIVDDLSIAKGRNNFKMGVNFRRDDVSDFRASELTNPAAINTTLLGFATDTVTTNTNQNFALASPQPIAIYSFGVYFQDELRVTPNLKLTAALRLDRNSGGYCKTKCVSLPAAPFQDLSHDPTIPFNQLVKAGQSSILRSVEAVVVEPRLGFAWTPRTRYTQSGNTVIRGGVGLFTDLYPGTILDNFTTNFPEVTSFAIPGGTVDPNEPGSGVSNVQACNTAFQTAFNSGQTLAQYQAAAPACAAALPPLYDSTSKTRNPKYVEWNLELQQAFGRGGIFSVNYVGNHGYDILLVNPYLNAFGFSTLPATAPDARITAVQQLTNGGYSNYNGLTASIQQSVRRGFSGRVSYTFSHATDNISNGGVPSEPYSIFNSISFQVDPTNPNRQYASSDYDVRHQLSAAYVWDLPVKTSNRWLNALIGGWQVSETFFWRTGLAFSASNVSQSFAVAGQNMTANGVLLASILYAPQPGGPTNFGSSCINTACFSGLVVPTTFNANARNAFRGPGYFNTDLNLKKTFKFTERLSFAVGANAFNILNHPNFQNPVTNNLSSNFGKITALVAPPTTPYGAFAFAAEGMRIVQVFGKLTF